jgi:hypothetical protein
MFSFLSGRNKLKVILGPCSEVQGPYSVIVLDNGIMAGGESGNSPRASEGSTATKRYKAREISKEVYLSAGYIAVQINTFFHYYHV